MKYLDGFMKKVALSLVLASGLLVGCESIPLINESPVPEVPEFIHTTGPEKNAVSEEHKAYEVFQVIDRGALALKCNHGAMSSCTGHVVLIPKSIVSRPWDGMIITLKNTKVIDTYRYETVNEFMKTVPVVIGEKP